MSSRSYRAVLSLVAAVWLSLSKGGTGQTVQLPDLRVRDPEVAITLVAKEPEVVTPTGLAVDALGRVFVAESHTHFPPDDYAGPQRDRILVLGPVEGTGQLKRLSIFFEGLIHTMDLAFHPDGVLYVATRNAIYRLPDRDGDLKADGLEEVVRLETTGNYPHNGLSGLAFDFAGNLYFGLGENLGHPYRLVASDGSQAQGGGEGGSTWRVDRHGGQLHRTSTGWWNPFGLCVDPYQRLFGTDNDPDASPPCRLIQILDGADCGYQYRYGRSGLHPLVSWTGERPGTIPMISGTGEAPCAVLSYDAAQLPARYHGTLLVASWADHRLEVYHLDQQPDRGTVTARREILVDSDGPFRPVDLAVGPDGAVYVSDWVLSSYTLHGHGRIWRLSGQGRIDQAADPLEDRDGRRRQAAARALASHPAGRQRLCQVLLHHPDALARATALQALMEVDDRAPDYLTVAQSDPSIAVRVLAVRAAAQHGLPLQALAAPGNPAAVRAEALRSLNAREDRQWLVQALRSEEPALLHAAVMALASQWESLREEDLQWYLQRAPLGCALAMYRAPEADPLADTWVRRWLDHPDLAVRRVAVQWVADRQGKRFLEDLDRLLKQGDVTFELFLAAATARDWLARGKAADLPQTDTLIRLLKAKDASPVTQRWALRALAGRTDGFSPTLWDQLWRVGEGEVRLELVDLLARTPWPDRTQRLLRLATDRDSDPHWRAEAILGLESQAEHCAPSLVQLATEGPDAVTDAALRALVGVPLPPPLRQPLQQLAKRDRRWREAVQRLETGRVLGVPESEDLAGWLARAQGAGDRRRGRRIFFSQKVARCGTCHRVHGRGTAVGPELTRLPQRLQQHGPEARRWLLQTILQPGQEMAPQYTPWQIVTTDGRILVGLPRRKGGGSEAYLGTDGKEFSIPLSQIALRRESPVSLMPTGLLASLTAQELRDLLAFLADPIP